MYGLFRKALIAIKGDRKFHYPGREIPIQDGRLVQDLIRTMLSSNQPCMIARFGSVELQAVVDYLNPPTFANAFQFIKGERPAWGYAPSTIRSMRINAGFFPPTRSMLDRFGQLMMDSQAHVDVLGCWRREESVVLPYIDSVTRVPLYTLEPYYFDNPWTTALEGKRVLVIHPFEETIRKQHESGRYEHLFADPRLTPDYELVTLKAVQSIAGNKPAEFDDWFEALEWMKSEIDKKDFEIAILGCGAYGFPLAAYVKQIGKKAIHLGGAVQNLFGINSRAMNDSDRKRKLVNSYWVFPSAEETPPNKDLVENGRYW